MKAYIDKAEHIVILTHMAPDGDAMGSALALWHYCNSQCTIHNAQFLAPRGTIITQCTRHNAQLKSVHVIVPNAYPAFLGWLPGAKEVKVYESDPSSCDQLIQEADLFLCTDFNDPKRIGPMGGKMLASAAPKVLIDHHLLVESQKSKDGDGAAQSTLKDGDGAAQSQKAWYDESHVDSGASSACEIVYKLINDKNGDAALNGDIATCIYTGLMTDTGNFSYNSTNAELYDIVASLLRAGVKKDEIYNAVYNQFTSERMRLTGYALYRKMRIYPEYHLALITLSADELDQYHYKTGDCEGIVNMPLQIADVYYSVFMREERAKPGTPKSRIRISLRSQGDRPVNIWANEVFHGGGHMNASGGEVLGSLGYAVKIFEQSYGKYVKKD